MNADGTEATLTLRFLPEAAAAPAPVAAPAGRLRSRSLLARLWSRHPESVYATQNVQV